LLAPRASIALRIIPECSIRSMTGMVTTAPISKCALKASAVTSLGYTSGVTEYRNNRTGRPRHHRTSVVPSGQAACCGEISPPVARPLRSSRGAQQSRAAGPSGSGMSCAHGRRPDASRRKEITSAAPTGDAIPTRTSDPAITRKLRAGLPDVPAASLCAPQPPSWVSSSRRVPACPESTWPVLNPPLSVAESAVAGVSSRRGQ